MEDEEYGFPVIDEVDDDKDELREYVVYVTAKFSGVIAS